MCSCVLYTSRAGNSVLREAERNLECFFVFCIDTWAVVGRIIGCILKLRQEFRVLYCVLGRVWADGLSRVLTCALAAIIYDGDAEIVVCILASGTVRMVNKL